MKEWFLEKWSTEITEVVSRDSGFAASMSFNDHVSKHKCSHASQILSLPIVKVSHFIYHLLFFSETSISSALHWLLPDLKLLTPFQAGE